MHRLHDWPERLAGFLDSRQGEPFAWGSNDCALFAADAVQAITGVDLAREFRGYSDEEGAATALASFVHNRPLWHGAESLLEAVTLHIAEDHDLSEIPSSLARRGDLVLLRHPEEEGNHSVGIIGLEGLPVGITLEHGPQQRPLEDVIHAWRI